MYVYLYMCVCVFYGFTYEGEFERWKVVLEKFYQNGNDGRQSDGKVYEKHSWFSLHRRITSVYTYLYT